MVQRGETKTLIRKRGGDFVKFLALLLTLVLLLAGLATGASAATLGYLDGIVNGTVEKDGTGALSAQNGEDDLKVTIISAGTLIQDRYKLGAEYGVGSIAGASKEDVTLWTVKAGYRLIDATAFKLDAIVAPLNIKTDSSSLKATLLGVDLAQYFSTKLFLTVSYVVGDGKYEKSPFKDDSAPVSFFRSKLHYLLTDNLGLVAGYSTLKYEFDAVLSGISVGSMDVTMGGPSLGLVYKF